MKSERQRDQKALFLFQIYQAIEVPRHERLTKASLKEAWATYFGKDQVNKAHLQSLRAEFKNLEIERKKKLLNIL